MAFVVAGALGAPARYLLDAMVSDRTAGAFPWGTFVINVTGSFLLGLLIGLGLHHGLPKPARLILGVAFCGAYTTFSTFSFETVRLLEAGDPVAAFKNAVATVLVGLAAGAAGLAVVAAGA
jgi:CrcB protein